MRIHPIYIMIKTGRTTTAGNNTIIFLGEAVQCLGFNSSKIFFTQFFKNGGNGFAFTCLNNLV